MWWCQEVGKECQKSMVVMGICWRGKSRAYIVEGSAKINADYLIQNILTPIFDKDIPNAWKVVLRMDAAPRYFAKKISGFRSVE